MSPVRRAEVGSVLLMASVVLTLLVAPTSAQAQQVAGRQTTSCRTVVTEGTVQGSRHGSTCVYRGIRYAAPPTGPRRFRPPAPPRPWRGVADAGRQLDVVCPRNSPNITESYTGPAPSSTQEDCLRLTVTTPRRTARPRPVIVYLHGGAFVSGSGFQQDFDARRLAASAGAVVVTVNYRLGVLGYLELGDLDPQARGSGNNGLRDQLAALRWVKRNAASFGGDASNVTAVGESAGAISISAMLAGRRPERLFHRAILQSGNGYLVRTAEQARATARGILATGRARTVADLRRLPVGELLRLQEDYLRARPVQRSVTFAPFVDGDLVPGPVLPRLSRGSARHVDVVIGTNRDEATFFALGQPALAYLPAVADPFYPESLRSRLVQTVLAYGSRRALLGVLPGRRGTTIALVSDQLFRVPATRMAEAQSRWNPRTFMYRFDWGPKAPAGSLPQDDVGAMHTIELPFVFGGLRLGWVPHGAARTSDERTARRLLSDRVMRAWGAFARTGSPVTQDAGVPRWPAYESTNRRTMLWDLVPSVASAPDEVERRTWDGYPFSALTYPLPIG